jgi:hypothetical protein
MLTTIARSLSYLFHPALLPSYLFSLLFFGSNVFLHYATNAKMVLLSFLFLGTFLLPITAIAFLKRAGYISSFEMPTHQERRLPFLLVALFYAVLTVFLNSGGLAGSMLVYILVAISQTVCLAVFVNIFYKISMHSIGLCGTLGVLFALQYHDFRYALLLPILLWLFVIGLVLSARLWLQVHDIQEVMWGSLLGFVSAFLSLWYLL